ncbi:MAG TPA: undecaprenyl-phosphate glucose phosphotransferase [Steroidobacteraceae bacterium]|nr:undecaprenyl-phosphate glucose phosphotransferase [Steroidobacteraceae bacterium]
MPQPILFKNSLSIALLALVQTTLSAAISVTSLFAFAYAGGMDIHENFSMLFYISMVLCLMLIRPPGDIQSQITLQPSLAVLRLLVQWLLIVAILLTSCLILARPVHPFSLFLSWALATPSILIVVTLITMSLARRLLIGAANNRSAIIAGYSDISCALSAALKNNPALSIQVKGFFDDRSYERLGIPDNGELIGKLTDISEYVKTSNIDVIFVALPMRHVQRVLDLLDDLRDTTASIYYVPDIFVFDLIQARFAEISGIPVVAMCETPFHGYRGIIKRLMDIAISAIALLLLSPVLIVAALAVKLTSPGPVIFKQRRYGLDGQEIAVYKFRSMRVTEDGAKVTQASKNDSRITKVGGFLRKTSIDELPQLINVLQGRMSLVGPRPHAVAHNEQYRKLIKGYMVRHKVLPGITGLAQVSGCRGETAKLEEMEARVNYDLEYLRHWSLRMDLKILFLTAYKIFKDDKAY